MDPNVPSQVGYSTLDLSGPYISVLKAPRRRRLDPRDEAPRQERASAACVAAACWDGGALLLAAACWEVRCM